MIASRSGARPAADAGGGRRRIVKQRRRELGRRHQEHVRDRVVGQPQPRRRQQRERPDQVRRVHGQLGRDPPAERRPDDVRAGSPGEPAARARAVEHVQIVVDEVVDGLDLGKVVGLAEPGMVGRDHLEPGRREPRVERKPGPGPARRVQEQHRLARPAPQQAHPPPGQLEELLRRRRRAVTALPPTGSARYRTCQPRIRCRRDRSQGG